MKPNSCDGGSIFIDALNILKQNGMARLGDFPYLEQSCTEKPDAAVNQKAREFAVADWRRVNVQDETEIKTQLASGFPVLIGMIIDDSFSRLEPRQIYKTRSGTGRGGHAMVVVGYSDSRSAFKVINSWGSDWGDGGFGWIDYSAFKQTVREAYTVQDIVINKPVQPPVTSPTMPPVVQPPEQPVVTASMPIILHNQTVASPAGPSPGMQIMLPGQITNASGRRLQIIIKFNYFNGPPLVANPAEAIFKDMGGLVATSTQPIPIGPGPISTEQIYISIPYYALNFQPTNYAANHNLSVTAIIMIDNIQLYQSPSVPFQFRW